MRFVSAGDQNVSHNSYINFDSNRVGIIMKCHSSCLILLISSSLLISQGIINFNTSNSGILSNDITSIAISKENHIWCGTGGIRPNPNGKGIAVFDNQTWSRIDTSNSEILSNDISLVQFDPLGNPWIGYVKKGLSTRSSSGWTHYIILTSGSDHDYVTFVFFNNNDIWIGTFLSGIYLFVNRKMRKWNISAAAAAKDNAGKIWFGAGTKIYKFGEQDMNYFEEYSPDFSFGNLTSLDIDQGNNIWIGTEGHGILKFDGHENWDLIQSPLYRRNLGDYINVVLVNKDNVWFGTHDGLWQFDGISWEYDLLQGRDVTCLAIDNSSNMWVGTSGNGVYKISGIADDVDIKPERLLTNRYLLKNYPNPFNDFTTISFYVQNSERIKLDIYNELGVKVANLAGQYMDSGDYKIKWSTEQVLSGLYFCCLEGENQREIIKIIVQK